ncbi:putative protein kinase RLK-Pelle-CR4L family [Helianthus anomalus]
MRILNLQKYLIMSIVIFKFNIVNMLSMYVINLVSHRSQENNKENLRMSLEDVKLATENFHDDNCIGERGSLGKVYIGKVPEGGGFRTIVVKRFDTGLGQGEQQFSNELQILWEYKHNNVIRLVGYCDEKDEKVIVYEYLSRRSLDGWYLNDASFTWIKRLNVCIGVASALDFLHGRKVIHGDIKAANILLNDDWEAKLAGFGLSLISPLYQTADYVCGTPQNTDPLYNKSSFLTEESDIYAFGMVLRQIFCGRSTLAINKYEGYHIPDYIRSDKRIVLESVTTFDKIIDQCLHQEREKRPTAKEVLMQLKKALEFQVSYHTLTRKVTLFFKGKEAFSLIVSQTNVNSISN